MAISFEEDLSQLLNRHSAEAPSGTPEFILGKLLTDTLKTFNEIIGLRAEWRGETVELPALTNLKLREMVMDANGMGSVKQVIQPTSPESIEEYNEWVRSVQVDEPVEDAREAQKLTDSMHMEGIGFLEDKLNESAGDDPEAPPTAIIPFSSADEGMDFPTKAKVILWDAIRDFSHIQYDEIYIVWFAYVTGGWKAMLSTSAADGAYYEVTFHQGQQKYYVDSYFKNFQTVFTSEHVAQK